MLWIIAFIPNAALIAPPKPPTAKISMASATLENFGSPQGSFSSQSNQPRAPFMRPATSKEATIVKAVIMLGKRIACVLMAWNSFHPASMPGSRNWWWKPTGVDSTMNITNTTRASGSLNSFPPACLGATVYQMT